MRIEKYPDKYNLEEYHLKQSQFGTIALLTNWEDSGTRHL
jgi:hypothetical protein